MNLIYVRALVLAIIVSLIGGVGYAAYSTIRQAGYDEASAKYEQKFKDYEKQRDEKIASIEALSTTLIEESRTNMSALTAGMDTILTAAKTKPLVVVKNGDCSPSQTFSDSISKINSQVNQSMKGK